MGLFLPVILLQTCILALAFSQDPVEVLQTMSPYHVVEDSKGQEASMEKGTVEKCDTVMASNGLNFSSFHQGPAHGIHSIFLEEIRHYFEPMAPASNGIPVVNKDLSAKAAILFDSPLAGYDEDFKTMALKVMAYFMLNDRPDFAISGLNTLEKLGHQYHMHEVYAAAAPIYKELKSNPPTDPELCPCINDITGNGILTTMANIAKTLKHFARQPRRRPGPEEEECTLNFEYGSCGITYRYGRRKREAENVTTEIVDQYQQEYLDYSSYENANKLMSVKPWIPNSLLGPEQWISYEAMLTFSMLNKEELNDFATFMYCKLNKPEE